MAGRARSRAVARMSWVSLGGVMPSLGRAGSPPGRRQLVVQELGELGGLLGGEEAFDGVHGQSLGHVDHAVTHSSGGGPALRSPWRSCGTECGAYTEFHPSGPWLPSPPTRGVGACGRVPRARERQAAGVPRRLSVDSGAHGRIEGLEHGGQPGAGLRVLLRRSGAGQDARSREQDQPLWGEFGTAQGDDPPAVAVPVHPADQTGVVASWADFQAPDEGPGALARQSAHGRCRVSGGAGWPGRARWVPVGEGGRG